MSPASCWRVEMRGLEELRLNNGGWMQSWRNEDDEQKESGWELVAKADAGSNQRRDASEKKPPDRRGFKHQQLGCVGPCIQPGLAQPGPWLVLCSDKSLHMYM